MGIACILLVSASFYLGLTFASCRWLLALTPVFLVLRMIMNTLDGMLAREYQTGSVAGELFNEGLDIVGDTVCYGVLLFVPGIPQLPLILFLLLTWMAEYFGVLGKSFPGGVRRHETFFGGKPDRAIWMGLMALLLFFFPGFTPYTGAYLLLASCFVFLTSVVRRCRTAHIHQVRRLRLRADSGGKPRAAVEGSMTWKPIGGGSPWASSGAGSSLDVLRARRRRPSDDG